jgi:hypothetical protein
MEAIWWDGSKQLKGNLEFLEDIFVFDLDDNKDSNLNISIASNSSVIIINHLSP